jgi:tripartite-type tricarboxylate transporter receptor subunit TctC
VHAPTGVSTEVMDRLAAAIDTAMKTPEIANRLKSVGIEPIGGTRASFVQFVSEERARLAAVVKISGMKED